MVQFDFTEKILREHHTGNLFPWKKEEYDKKYAIGPDGNVVTRKERLLATK